MRTIELDPADEESRRLWASVGDLVAALPDAWVLIGGLMVQLHAVEQGAEEIRVTTDIDVLGQARPPGALSAIDEATAQELSRQSGHGCSTPPRGWRSTGRRISARTACGEPARRCGSC